MPTRDRPAFTIVELLVTISIIALLISILMPAVTSSREQAKLTHSFTNLRNLGTAHAAYAAGHNDRQLTFVADGISRYGSNACEAFGAYAEENGPVHSNVVLGWGPEIGEEGGSRTLWQYRLDGTYSGHHCWAGNPIHMAGSGFGQFRFGHQTRAMSPYLTGRYYDPIYFAPKDALLYEIVSPGFESPAQFASIPADDGTEGSVLYTSSYCLSPAAMYTPDAFRWDEETGRTFEDPWTISAGLRCPSTSQALYPSLKTHMLEHSWLQNVKQKCNPGFTSPGTYRGCQPYFFNHAWDSEPITLFFDGHVEPVGVREAQRADSRHEAQAGYGLWSRDTDMGPDGYFISYAYDMAETSFHILTTDGIRGRDVVSK